MTTFDKMKLFFKERGVSFEEKEDGSIEIESGKSGLPKVNDSDPWWDEFKAINDDTLVHTGSYCPDGRTFWRISEKQPA